MQVAQKRKKVLKVVILVAKKGKEAVQLLPERLQLLPSSTTPRKSSSAGTPEKIFLVEPEKPREASNREPPVTRNKPKRMAADLQAWIATFSQTPRA